jgi:hypothetical protein
MGSLTILGETYNSGDRILFNVVDDFHNFGEGHIIKQHTGVFSYETTENSLGKKIWIIKDEDGGVYDVENKVKFLDKSWVDGYTRESTYPLHHNKWNIQILGIISRGKSKSWFTRSGGTRRRKNKKTRYGMEKRS